MVIKVLGYKRRVGVRGGPPKINAGGGAGQPPADTSSRALKSRTLALTPGTNSHGRVHSRSSPFKSSGLGLRSAWRVRGPIFGVSWTRAPLGVAGPEVMKPLGLKACRGHKTADKRGRRAAAGGGGREGGAELERPRNKQSRASGAARRAGLRLHAMVQKWHIKVQAADPNQGNSAPRGTRQWGGAFPAVRVGGGECRRHPVGGGQECR